MRITGIKPSKNPQLELNVLIFKRLRYPPIPIEKQLALLHQMQISPPLNGTPDAIIQILPQENPEVTGIDRNSFDLVDKIPLSVAMLRYRDYFCVQQLQFQMDSFDTFRLASAPGFSKSKMWAMSLLLDR